MTATPTPTTRVKADQEDKEMATPLSPPASSAEGDVIGEDQDEDDLYATSNDDLWEAQGNSSFDSPVNPQWLLSSDPPHAIAEQRPQQHHPSPPGSEDSMSPEDQQSAVDNIQKRNEGLVKTGVIVKGSKSFPLLPEILKLKHADDEDEKILASEEGKKLNPKERRQLRNKVSARNFRVRRKGMFLPLTTSNIDRIYWSLRASRRVTDPRDSTAAADSQCRSTREHTAASRVRIPTFARLEPSTTVTASSTGHAHGSITSEQRRQSQQL